MIEIDKAKPIVKRAIELGVNFFDTANLYSNGRSEEIVGELLKDHRDDVAIATKVRLKVGEGPNKDGLSRYHVLQQAHVGAIVRIKRRKLLDDKPRHVRRLALHVLAIDAVVADQRIGHGDDLTLVAGIGEDLLIAGHRGVEDDFALGGSGSAKGAAGENGAVFEGEFRGGSGVCHWGADYRNASRGWKQCH